MSDISLQDKKVITPKFRVSFPSLEKPKAFRGGEPKYEITMLFDKSTNLSASPTNKEGKPISKSMREAVKNACIDKWGDDESKWPKKTLKNGKVVSAIRMPFRDGDREKGDQKGYQNAIFVRAWSKADSPPGIIDQQKNPLDGKAIYAGCYARAVLIAFAYGDPKSGIKPGVSFSLQHVQKIGDGEKFGGKRAASEELDSVEDESDMPEHYPDEVEETDSETEDNEAFT